MLKKATKLLLTIMAALCFTGLYAQTVIFSEDFETSPVTSIINNDDSALGEGESPCGYATRGNASDYNSSNVDMNAAENGGYYLGVNPESPCGGFYDAIVKTSSPLDFTDMDSLRFSFRYYKTSTMNTLGWGDVVLSFEFNNGSETFSIYDGMLVQDTWTIYDTVLPASMLDEPSVDLLFSLGGGEAVAIDDIEIRGWDLSKINTNKTDSNISFFPNPAKDHVTIHASHDAEFSLMNALGKQVLEQKLSKGENTVSLNQLPAGIYYIRVWERPGDIKTHKLLIR